MKWSDSLIKEVSECLGHEIKWIHVGYNHFQGRTTPIENKRVKKTDLIIGYNDDLEVFVAWNALIHQKDNYKTQSFMVNKKYVSSFQNDSTYEDSVIFPIYRAIHGKKPYCEKILIIKPEFLYEFCKEPFAYLLPDQNDIGYCANTLYANPNEKIPMPWTDSKYVRYSSKAYREYNSCNRANRDARFRKYVFKKYSKPHCLICGIDVEKILEAAHIIAVKDGGSDDPSNGICLCRNHHKLCDDKIIILDVINNTFSVNDERIAESFGWQRNKTYLLK